MKASAAPEWLCSQTLRFFLDEALKILTRILGSFAGGKAFCELDRDRNVGVAADVGDDVGDGVECFRRSLNRC